MYAKCYYNIGFEDVFFGSVYPPSSHVFFISASCSVCQWFERWCWTILSHEGYVFIDAEATALFHAEASVGSWPAYSHTAVAQNDSRRVWPSCWSVCLCVVDIQTAVGNNTVLILYGLFWASDAHYLFWHVCNLCVKRRLAPASKDRNARGFGVRLTPHLLCVNSEQGIQGGEGGGGNLELTCQNWLTLVVVQAFAALEDSFVGAFLNPSPSPVALSSISSM